jgi:hypothetical protein
MKPITVSVDVPNPQEEVFDFLDVMSNHGAFNDHVMHDWQYSGPDRGVGSKARVEATLGGRTDQVDIEVVSAERPTIIVERNTGAGGRRVATGTYRLEQLPAGGTRVGFEYAWQSAPASERLAAPIVRGVMRRSLTQSMGRLAELLARQRPPVDA